MLHSHLTTLNAVSLILNTFKAEGLSAKRYWPVAVSVWRI